jgi:hypothetical protein
MIWSSRMPFVILLTVVALGFSADLNQARADLIFSENFNSISGMPSSDTEPTATERWSGTLLVSPITLPGWTLEGDTSEILALDHAGDKSIWLNERGATPEGSAERSLV